MRENGTLRYKIVSGTDSFDEHGNPVAADVRWSAAIPCLVNTISESMKARYEDGEYHDVSMEVFVEYMQPLCQCGGSVMLERKGECLGEFRIVRIEEFTTVGRVKLIV